jgi:hypothetical protein
MTYSLTGKISDLSLDFRTGRAKLTLELNEKMVATALYDEHNQTEKLSVKISKFREKRSLNANNFAWLIINEIANVLRASKEEIYLKLLKRYGQSDLISVLDTVPIDKYVKYYDEAGESTLNGKLFKHYRVYKGSSEFDTREMSIFIDGVVSEAKELGIPTETPDQIAKLKSLWGE